MRKLRILFAAAALASASLTGAAAQDADTPVDRALQQVEALLETLRAQAGTDPKTIQRLEAIAAELRKAKGDTGTATPPAPGAPAGGGLPPGALDRAKEWFFRGVELKDEERTRAEEVLKDFATDFNLAKTNGDEKSRKVIKEHTQKRLSKGFPSREANRMKENLDGIVDFWEGRFGRR